ncbi:unnamed protein product [Rotaria sp. Silwood1]|nr:unnamed protein product [Rotaria sp. Silwood1]CAF3409561.1 unnamed protein product [Rotaria sp. Silwood1]CAF4824340.1 unnamed protein product [Rotaria sp. Silwood1]
MNTKYFSDIFLVAITNVDCRPGSGRGKITRVRVSKSPLLHKSNTHILVRGATGGGTALLFGTLALRSYVLNNHKGSIKSSHMLINGSGSLCLNRENFSNFIFNEFRCPLLPIFALNNRYCCGSFQQQYCCSFWESGSRAIASIIGIIAGCSIFILFIFYCIVYIRRYLRPKESSSVKSYIHYHFQTQLYSAVFMLSLIEGKGLVGGRGGGGFKVGSKGTGTFGGASSYNRANSYRSQMGQPRSGSSFKGKAISFAAGAATGIAAYSIMRSMAGSHQSRPGGYYPPGYGTGETCANNENMNGTVFGEFRCPLNGFPRDAKYCCGEYGQQYCCAPDRKSFFNKASHFAWIIIVIIIFIIVALLWIRCRRQRQKDAEMIPTEPPMNQDYEPPPPFYHPPPHNQNQYGVPPQNQSGNFNPYVQQSYMPYPPQQQPTYPY